ncbi:MAG: hypothetical protein M0Z41_06765 [Peptococcaceae bacterium]|nr:hypothetical protein [Peptococcaceae bacterium]
MSKNDGIVGNGGNCEGRVEVHYQFPGRSTKYYLLTAGSGYPSAEFRFPLSGPDRRLVVPEAAKSSANPPPEG